MASIPTIPKPAEAYGRNPLVIPFRLQGYGPIAGRAWAAQLKRRPGDDVAIVDFVVEAADEVIGEVANVLLDLHVPDPDDVDLIPVGEAGSWFDVVEVPVDGEPFAIFRQQLVRTAGVTSVG